MTEQLRHVVEQRFPYVWVQGEVTNVSRPSSGHVYFSLKEGDCLLACVWFRGQQRAQEHFDPLTGEVWEGGPRPSLAFSLENGREILCAGRLSVYGPRGSYQLVVELAQETGQGRWHLAFEELKQKLAAEGFFRQERKRPLPAQPQRIALITAPTGAALHDFLRIAAERGLGSRIRLYPVPVQGDEAPPRIVNALQSANAQAWADIIVLIRGGGSIQDLWAFNDERVARAIFTSHLPVLTGVGHEIDHSIADFVADKSAATPSHAAQLLWSERRVYVQRVDDAESALKQAFLRRIHLCAGHLAHWEQALNLLSPTRRLQAQHDQLQSATMRLRNATAALLLRHAHSLDAQKKALHHAGGPARLASLQSRLDTLCWRLHAAGKHALLAADRALERQCQSLAPLGENRLRRLAATLEYLCARLGGLNPHAPLERGYALVRLSTQGGGTRNTAKTGPLLRSVRDIAHGASIAVELYDGTLAAQVLEVQPAPADLCTKTSVSPSSSPAVSPASSPAVSPAISPAVSPATNKDTL